MGDYAVVGLTRRQLGLCGAAVGLLGVKAVAQPVTPSVQLPDGSRVPALVRDPGTLLKVDTRLRRKRKLYEPASL